MVPMLFMGEEWGSKAPFPFFCDFHGDLAEAVRQGRRKEFAGAYAKYGDEIPDPLAISTVQSAVLDWPSHDQESAHKRLALVRGLLSIRRKEIIPRLDGAVFGRAYAADNGLLTADWRMGDGATLRLTANLSAFEISPPPGEMPGTTIWGNAKRGPMPAWSVLWRLEAR
jgi:1,4-alpha-glucan branching enzyme